MDLQLGRPFSCRLDREDLRRVDAWRVRLSMGRSNAVRALVRLGLEQVEAEAADRAARSTVIQKSLL